MTVRPARMRALVALLAVSSMLVLGSCSFKGGATQRELMLIVGGWFAGIQERNFDLLARYDFDAPDPKTPEFAAFKEKVNTVLDAYETAKLAGTWQPDPKGYTVIKATLIGANPGTFWGAPGREGTVDEPVLVVQASFAYDELGDQRLHAGTHVFVQGYPVGKVYRLEIGGPDKGRELDVLDTLRVKVYLKRFPGASDDQGGMYKYKVLKAELVDGSAKHHTVKWTS